MYIVSIDTTIGEVLKYIYLLEHVNGVCKIMHKSAGVLQQMSIIPDDKINDTER